MGSRAIPSSVVLIATPDVGLRQAWRRLLSGRAGAIVEASDTAGALQATANRRPALIMLAASFHESRDGLDTALQIRQRDRDAPIIVVAKTGSEELAVACLRGGITDYLSEAASTAEVEASIDACLARGATAPPRARADLSEDRTDAVRMIGESASMRDVKRYIAQAASTDCSVLVTGESGTGKELVAQLIHAASDRRRRALMCINCAAIPEGLVESELFGYERGAFTGAQSAYEGKLTQADGGTAFFDEIGDMSAYAQAKILRLTESREIIRLGGRRGIALDIRIVAATNQDLERLVAEGRFRRDLYFRLNVARIQLPPLRERREDIPLLVEHFIAELNRRYATDVTQLTAESLDHLLAYGWPGNVRELRNVLEAVWLERPPGDPARLALPDGVRRRLLCDDTSRGGERDRLLSALRSTNWNKSRAAQHLQWSRMKLYRKMAKYAVATPLIAEPATADRENVEA